MEAVLTSTVRAFFVKVPGLLWLCTKPSEFLEHTDRTEELAERFEASVYDVPASEVQAGLELNLPWLVVTGQGSSGYKIIEEFLPRSCLTGTIHKFESERRAAFYCSLGRP